MQIDNRHPAEKHLSAFEEPFLKADSSFWKIVDGARKHLPKAQRPVAYASMHDVANELSAHRHIVQAILNHPEAGALPGLGGLTPHTPERERSIHDLGYKIVAMGAYRSSRHIVQLDPALEKELFERDLPVDAPASLLKNLPGWGIFLEYGASTKQRLGEYAADGAFLSLYQDEESLVLDVRPLASGSVGLPRLLISVHDDNDLSRFLNGLKSEPSWPLLKLVCNTALHLSAGAPTYQTKQKIGNPPGATTSDGTNLKAPTEPVYCRIGAPHEIQAATRAIEFVDRARPAHSTPQP